MTDFTANLRTVVSEGEGGGRGDHGTQLDQVTSFNQRLHGARGARGQILSPSQGDTVDYIPRSETKNLASVPDWGYSRLYPPVRD
jgi:hypothetical protein